MTDKIDELLKKEKQISKKRLRIEEAKKQREEEEERIRLEKKRMYLEQLALEKEIAESRIIPVCPVCNKILRTHSTYVDKERGEIIHKDCAGIITDTLLKSHRGISKGISK